MITRTHREINFLFFFGRIFHFSHEFLTLWSFFKVKFHTKKIIKKKLFFVNFHNKYEFNVFS
jgi:hypothetical protein